MPRFLATGPLPGERGDHPQVSFAMDGSALPAGFRFGGGGEEGQEGGGGGQWLPGSRGGRDDAALRSGRLVAPNGSCEDGVVKRVDG